MQQKLCDHLKSIELKQTDVYECAACVAQGDTWVHLRLCQTCGQVNCCDNSKNKHATKHYHDTQHPVITSAEPGERWAWCYADEQMAGY